MAVTPIPPRREEVLHRGKKATLQFNPKTRKVEWVIEKTYTIPVRGENADWHRARKAAKQKIDEMLDGEK